MVTYEDAWGFEISSFRDELISFFLMTWWLSLHKLLPIVGLKYSWRAKGKKNVSQLFCNIFGFFRCQHTQPAEFCKVIFCMHDIAESAVRNTSHIDQINLHSCHETQRNNWFCSGNLPYWSSNLARVTHFYKNRYGFLRNSCESSFHLN